MPNLDQMFSDFAAAGGWVVVFQLLLILIATLIALRFARVTVAAALRRLFDREVSEGTAQDISAIELQRRWETLDGLVYRALRVIILIIAFLMTLQVLRLDIGPAIAGLGIVGLALSLGAQHLVRDYVAGAFVLIENQYSKGDVVTIANVTGTVEDVSLRRTTLRDFDGTVHYVPHGLIQTSSNLTRTWAGVNLDVPVPYEQSLSRVTTVIDRAAKKLADDPAWQARILEVPRVSRVERLAEAGIVLKVTGRVAAVHRFEAIGALRRAILEEAVRRKVTIGWRPVAEEEPPEEPEGGAPATGSARDASDEAGAAIRASGSQP